MTSQTAASSSRRELDEIVTYLRDFRVPTQEKAPEEKFLTSEFDHNGHVLLDQNHTTAGMRSFYRQLFERSHSEYQLLLRRFRDLLSPVAPLLVKYSKIDERKQTAIAEINRAEEFVLQSWRHGEHYRISKSEMEQAEEIYKSFRDSQGQREPTVTPILISALILLVIGVVEWLINYDAFLATFGVPALAVGFTAVVALAVAVASHFHGTYFKQRDFYFGRNSTSEQKLWRIIWLFFATGALAGAFVFVGWNRYAWAQEIIARAGNQVGGLIPEASTIGSNLTQNVWWTMLSNIVVWITGTSLVFLMHDENPAFANSFVKREKYRKRYLRLRSKIDDEIRVFIASREQEINALDSQRQSEEDRDSSVGQLSRWQKEVDDLKQKLDNKFSVSVQEAIERYRFAFFRHPHASDLVFHLNGETFGIAEYMKMPVRGDIGGPNEEKP